MNYKALVLIGCLSIGSARAMGMLKAAGTTVCVSTAVVATGYIGWLIYLELQENQHAALYIQQCRARYAAIIDVVGQPSRLSELVMTEGKCVKQTNFPYEQFVEELTKVIRTLTSIAEQKRHGPLFEKELPVLIEQLKYVLMHIMKLPEFIAENERQTAYEAYRHDGGLVRHQLEELQRSLEERLTVIERHLSTDALKRYPRY